MPAAAPVCGVILGAGASVRMGRPKQLLPLGGNPLLQYVIDAAAASRLDEIVVVLGHRADEVLAAVRLPARARSVRNLDYAGGMASSLIAGARAAGARAGAICVLLGDEPSVGADVIDRVLDAYEEAARPIVRAVYVAPDGTRTPGHPVVLGREVWPAMEQLSGDEGMRGIIAAHPEWVHEVDITAAGPRDIDTPDDYLRASERQGGGRE